MQPARIRYGFAHTTTLAAAPESRLQTLGSRSDLLQTSAVPDRDLGVFDERADVYESGWRGRLHHQIADEATGVALRVAPTPARILDVGCGTGYLLRELAEKLPAARVLRGIDPAPRMIEVARSVGDDVRLTFAVGVAEICPTRMGASI